MLQISSSQIEQLNFEPKDLSYKQCTWIGNHYNRKLGGIDVCDGKGLNGSIAPQATLDVLRLLFEAADERQTPPVFIDAGTAEGRALLYWAFSVSARRPPEFNFETINVYGFELPHKKSYEHIHRASEACAKTKLGCPVKINVVWKDVAHVESLKTELGFLNETESVLYSFWTAWSAENKDSLLALIGEEPNVVALAVYIRRGDTNSSGGPFDEQHILSQLQNHSSSSTWSIFSTVPLCRFIAGNERARSVIFSRHKQSCIENATRITLSDTLHPLCNDGFSVLDQDGWVEMCMECGGGGGG